MNRPVMDPAERDNELVADLAAQRTRLREAQVVGIGRFPPAHETGLLGDKPEVLFVAVAPRFSNRKDALIDCPRSIVFERCGLRLLGGCLG